MTEKQLAQAAYVHIPFCSHICHYCDFAKVLVKGQPVTDYLSRLIVEYQSYEISQLKTLYIGGGTPTVLSPQQMDFLLSNLTASLDLSKLEEFTIEANPGDLTEEMIEILAASPVNRISLGVQTFDDKLLKKIGRSHTEADVYQSLDRLKASGFENLTVDLIYGLPKQTLAMVKADLDKLLALDLPHIALYSLILEDHTIFMNAQRSGKLHLPSEELNADMYEYIVSRLTDAGYEHYEVSNFSKPGYESKHNLTYWENSPYYGIGAGASGYLEGVRYKNHGPVIHYLTADNKRFNEEIISVKEQIEEEFFLGLRKKSGVRLSAFEAKFNRSFDALYGATIQPFLNAGLLVKSDDRLFLTEKGFELGNEVFQAFLLDDLLSEKTRKA